MKKNIPLFGKVFAGFFLISTSTFAEDAQNPPALTAEQQKEADNQEKINKVKAEADAKAKAEVDEAVKILTSSDQISQGQTVTWLVNVYGFSKLNDGAEPAAAYYAPANSTSKIIRDNGSSFTVDFSPDNGPKFTCLWLCDGRQKYDPRICDKNDEITKKSYKCVSLDETYEIRKVDAAKYHHRTSGFVSGLLVVPFKYHFSDHAVTSGSSVGGYFGRRLGFFNSSVALVAGGGLAVINDAPAKENFSTGNSQASSDNSKDNQTGFTLATGLLGTIGESNAQIGLLIGWDYLGDNAQYKYEAKPWLAFEVGYNFSQ